MVGTLVKRSRCTLCMMKDVIDQKLWCKYSWIDLFFFVARILSWGAVAAKSSEDWCKIWRNGWNDGFGGGGGGGSQDIGPSGWNTGSHLTSITHPAIQPRHPQISASLTSKGKELGQAICKNPRTRIFKRNSYIIHNVHLITAINPFRFWR